MSSDLSISRDEFSSLLPASLLKQEVNRCAVAVSGGPDSMALAYCLHRWSSYQAQPLKVIAFIVDHGLRGESAEEARATKARLEALGIEAAILEWKHDIISSRIHVRARKARYQLLVQACKEHDIRLLFLGHQREDQAETILMRLAKGTGIDGLAGIARSSSIDNVTIDRPFLEIAKGRLMATCQEASLQFVMDPSNASDKYARGRLRKVMPLLAEEGFTIERLNELGARAGEAREALEFYTDSFLHASSVCDVTGVLHIDHAAFSLLPYAIAERVMMKAFKFIQASDYPPERASLLELVKSFQTLEHHAARTLHGSVILRTSSKIVVLRELSAIRDSVSLGPGQSALWDGRWWVTLPESFIPGVFTIRPLGNPAHQVVDNLAPELRHKVPQGRYRAVIPALWQDDTLCSIPSVWPVDKCEWAQAKLAQSWP